MVRRRPIGWLAALAAASLVPLVGGAALTFAAADTSAVEDPVLLAAGDIASCGSSGDEETAALLDLEPGATIATLGDMAYDSGTAQEFADCYTPSWGRHLQRTFPSPGNHEYLTPGATPYFDYFGARAGPSGVGYYSYELGTWHVVSLNGNCTEVPGGCGVGSPQEAWLRADLEASNADCTLAYWHQAPFSSGVTHGQSDRMRALLDLLYAHHADVLLTGHEHNYERFGLQTPDRTASSAGFRAFVVGTGGKGGSYAFTDPRAPNSEVQATGVRGVLKLTLRAGRYDWQFVPVAGQTFTDSGSEACRTAAPPDATAPTAPSGLTATSPSGSRVDLAWTAATDDIGVAGYRVFRDGVELATTTAMSWTDSTVSPATSYAYHVVAYDAALNVSPPSNTATVTTRSADGVLTFTPDADATIESANPTTNFGSAATLQADASPVRSFLVRFAVSGVGAGTVTGAKLRLHVTNPSGRGGDFRAASTGWSEGTVTWQTAPAGGALIGSAGAVVVGTWLELALPAGAVSGDGAVAFRVDSTSSDGVDYVSSEGTAGLAPQLVLTVAEPAAPDTQAPTAPSGLVATGSASTAVDLSWTASSDDVGVAGYRVFRDGVQITTTSTTAWRDTGLSPATTYAYAVVAFDQAQNASPPSDTVTVTTPGDSTPPTAPTGLTATVVSGTWVGLAWTAATDDIGVAGYRVLRDGAEIATTTGTAWADRTVSPATTYRYEIVAFDAALNPSAPSNAVTAATLPPGTDESLPLRAALYYPWFPEAWTQSSIFPYTKYTPSLGFYDSSTPTVIAAHLAALEYAKFDAAIASWWGRGTRTDGRLDDLLERTRTAGSSFKWTVYHEAEARANPTVEELREELAYLRDRYSTHPNFLRVGGRFVVFVYNVGDTCEVVDRWRAANTVGAYLVLRVFSGHRDCAQQPDAWHQYEPATAASSQGTDSFSISPGFENMTDPAPRLVRDLDRWRQNVRELLSSGAAWLLVTTFNEWGEGTAVESAQEWASASGYGTYLDVLHEDGAPPPAPPPAERTLVLTPSDDASVRSGSPTRNFGTATTLEADASPLKAFLLKFAVDGVGGDTVTAAKLRLHASNGSDRGGDFSLTATSWSESTVTWSTAPSAGASLGSLGRVFAGNWYELPLPAGAVSGDGLVGVRVGSPSGDGAAYVSKEGTAGLAPQLVLTVSEPAVPDTQPPTTPTGLTATALSGGGVDLAWSASSDDVLVAGYRILRDGAELTTTTSTAHTDTTTAPATTYTYQVAAFDPSGNASPLSDPVTVTTADAPRTLTFTPTADAYVERDAPTVNRGATVGLKVDNSPVKSILLKFAVTGIGAGTVTEAKLRLRVINSSNRGGDFSTTSDAWTESTVTWANAPPAGTRVGSLAAVASGTWQELTLAAGTVTADGNVDFRVDSTSSDGADYSAREAGLAVAPQLIVTVSGWPALNWQTLR